MVLGFATLLLTFAAFCIKSTNVNEYISIGYRSMFAYTILFNIQKTNDMVITIP